MSNSLRVLVTGGSGFIGLDLVKGLLNKNYNVCSIDIHPIKFSHPNLIHRSVDLLNGSEIKKIIKEYNPDYVFHLAAFNSNPESFKNSKFCFDLNFNGTLNLFDELRNFPVKKIFLPSSYYLSIQQSQEYFDSPYTLSKNFQEQLARHYSKFFSLPVTIFRLANVFGKTGSKETLVGSLIQKIINQDSTIQLGELNIKRDFIFLDDVVSALLALLSTQEIIPELIEIGTGQGILLKDLVNIVKDEADYQGSITSQSSISASNMTPSLIADTSFLTNSLHWKPQYSLREGLRLIITSERESIK